MSLDTNEQGESGGCLAGKASDLEGPEIDADAEKVSNRRKRRFESTPKRFQET